jgi:hypothetical protein
MVASLRSRNNNVQKERKAGEDERNEKWETKKGYDLLGRWFARITAKEVESSTKGGSDRNTKSYQHLSTL